MLNKIHPRCFIKVVLVLFYCNSIIKWTKTDVVILNPTKEKISRFFNYCLYQDNLTIHIKDDMCAYSANGVTWQMSETYIEVINLEWFISRVNKMGSHLIRDFSPRYMIPIFVKSLLSQNEHNDLMVWTCYQMLSWKKS